VGPPQELRDASNLIDQPSILLLKSLSLNSELCNFTLKTFDFFQMMDLGGEEGDLWADCFEAVVYII
jgi:hypothetical protein